MERGQGKPSPYERIAPPPSRALRVNSFLAIMSGFAFARMNGVPDGIRFPMTPLPMNNFA